MGEKNERRIGRETSRGDTFKILIPLLQTFKNINIFFTINFYYVSFKANALRMEWKTFGCPTYLVTKMATELPYSYSSHLIIKNALRDSQLFGTD